MITKKQVRECKAAAKSAGYADVKKADIAYITICKTFEDKNMAYKLLFRGKNQLPQEEYEASDKMVFLRRYVEDLIRVSKGCTSQEHQKIQSAETMNETISFEENRDALARYIDEIDDAVERGEMDLKDAYTLKVNIRNKLNEKFNIKEQITEQLVIVQPKFNHICDKTQKECWLQTKDFAMQHWHLIDDPNYKD